MTVEEMELKIESVVQRVEKVRMEGGILREVEVIKVVLSKTVESSNLHVS